MANKTNVLPAIALDEDKIHMRLALENPDQPGTQVTFNYVWNDGRYDPDGESPLDGEYTEARQQLFEKAQRIASAYAILRREVEEEEQQQAA